MYIGPETMLPLASALTGLAAFVLLLRRKLASAWRAVWNRLVGPSEGQRASAADSPEEP